MKIINQHIEKHLASFVENPNELFEVIFSSIENDTKEILKDLLIYIDKVISNSLIDNNQLNYLHLHLNKDLSFNERSLILEFLIKKHFYLALQNDTNQADNEYVKKKISSINTQLMKLQECPAQASGQNGGNRIYKNWIKEKNERKEELKFYNSISKSKTINTKTIVNTLTKYYNECVDLFYIKHYGVEVEKINRLKSYVTFNKEKKISQIDNIPGLVDNLTNVILFDSASKSNFFNFNYKELSDWNNDGAKFRSLLICSFGRNKINIHSLKNVIAQIEFRFKAKKLNSYTITNSEINKLSKSNKHKQLKVKFFDNESITFWDSFFIESKIHDNLYELISIKMMNIYSLTLNENIKNIIITSIFEQTSGMSLISENTKNDIPEELKQDLKESLSNLLDYIINSNWNNEIRESINDNTTLVISEQFVNNSELKSELVKELGLTRKNRINTWKDINSTEQENLLILNYLDPGHYPYYFHPNIIELSASNSNALFLNFFFKNKYEWAIYNNANDYYKLLNQEIRTDFFDWQTVKKEIYNLKPKVKEQILWDIESSYINSGNRDIIRINFKGNERPHNYHTSDLFICKHCDSITAKRAIELLNFNMAEIEIQNLDDVTDTLPIYDKLADINKQERELDVIRKSFNIADGNEAGRLWKLLLKRESDIKGKEVLYSEIKELLNRENLKIVSFHHFENHWINPDSESLSPLVKKVFITICNYLALPKTYIILIQRIKNKTKQASRNNTRKMNALYKDLFNDCCFDDISSTREILNEKRNYYAQNHSLEELGIDENHLLENLVALVELIYPEINLKKVDSIENISL